MQCKLHFFKEDDKMFVDEAKIFVKGGDGGNGCVSFHREKYVPHGGPDGGNGGKGGDVILRGSRSLNNLGVFKKRVHIKAKKGQHGKGNNCFGKDGPDEIVDVPSGTIVYDYESGKIIGDITEENQTLVVATGGRGGRGNASFATANYKLPRFAEKGEKGQARWIKLELRVIAHVGIIGMPNAGKSTLLAALTNAKPKIADYSFTTISVNLGVFEKTTGIQYILADIPGLIEGAATGAGLGHKFLRHVSRTEILIHVIDLTGVEPDNPLNNYWTIRRELENFEKTLIEKPEIVAANKTDVVGTEEAYFSLEKELDKIGVKCFPISAAGRRGLEELKNEIFSILEALPSREGKEPEHMKDFMVVDETTEQLEQFRIEKEGRLYRVKGKNPERMVQMTDLENEEAVRYLQARLKRMGVEESLEQMGIEDGDTVLIGDYEFDYFKESEFADL